MYKCQNCNKEFKNKGDYDRHLKRKNPCKKLNTNCTQIIPDTILKLNSIICNNCNKEFKNKHSIYRHKKKYCKKEIKNVEELEDRIDELEELVKELNNKYEISNSITKVNKVNADNNTTNSNNMINSNNINNTAEMIVNNNIKLVKFGEEDLKNIALEAIKYLNGYEGFYNLIKDVHFNEEVPENHNIYVTNSKFKNVCVYDGTNWLLRNLEEIREELIDKKYDFLCDRFDKLKGESKITASMEKKFMRFCKNYSELTGKEEKDFKNSIDLILYNNRDIAIDTKSKIKKSKNILGNKKVEKE